MSDTDISSDSLDNPRFSNISTSQDIQETSDNVFYTSQQARYPKTSSVESDQSSIQEQEFPLDLSMRSSMSRGSAHSDMCSMSSSSTSEGISGKYLFPSRRHPLLSSSSHSYRSLSSESSSKSQGYAHGETVSPNTSLDNTNQWLCPLCNQGFSLHDRLAKHMASRHKSRSTDSSSSRAFICEVCKRTFARSDMLTRHMRLHTGYKPYSCQTCGQVFSRSDHLSTHQRTHTGEKPYKCPCCPYSACRRDMITRHLRTHNRYHQESSSIDEAVAALPELSLGNARSVSTESESLSKDSADIKMSQDGSDCLTSNKCLNSLSHDFSESCVSQDFSENGISFDLSEQRFFGDKNDDASFQDQSSRDLETVKVKLGTPSQNIETEERNQDC